MSFSDTEGHCQSPIAARHCLVRGDKCDGCGHRGLCRLPRLERGKGPGLNRLAVDTIIVGKAMIEG